MTYISSFVIVPAIPLNRGTDVVFLLDVSRGVTEDILKQEKEFVKSLAINFNISPFGPRGAAVMYADNPYTIGSFIERDLESRIDRASLLNTPKRTDRVVEHASQIFKTSGRAGRKIVVLLTAGKRAAGGKPLSEAIQPLHAIGAQIFVVSIGDGPDTRDLSLLLHAPEDLFSVRAPKDLPSQTLQIGRAIRNKPGVTMYCMFLVHTFLDEVLPAWKCD